MHRFCRWSMIVTCLTLLAACQDAIAAGGKLRLTVTDSETGKPIACRMHLKNQVGRPVKAKRQPYFHDHFVFDGQIQLELPRGNYLFELECGPEYLQRTGHFAINDFADDAKHVDMRRFIDMAHEGWWSGDLDVHRGVKDIELLMRADDLHVVPLVTWTNKTSEWKRRSLPKQLLVQFDENRYCHLLGGQDRSDGGTLLLLNLDRPMELRKATREFPTGLDVIEQARQQMADSEGSASTLWVDAPQPFAWDLPMWVAHGAIDSVGLAHSHMQRMGMLARQPEGRPRDADRLPAPLGPGLWTQEIYYHLLNCGLRLPPSAGSGSGVQPNPVGYNRMYVFVAENFSYQSWWEGFKAGRVMVTNGPLIRPIVAGKLPGHVFQAPAGGEVNLDAVLNMATRDKVSYLEVVKNGKVDISLRVEDWAKTGQLPAIHFDESGWFLVRAVADNDKTFRFASTAPYYVEIGGQRRISRTSAQFFLDWTFERRGQIELRDAEQRAHVLARHDKAREFWEEMVEKANAE